MSTVTANRLSPGWLGIGVCGDGEQVNGADGDDDPGDGVNDGGDQAKSDSTMDQ